jgi:hypothetical protein
VRGLDTALDLLRSSAVRPLRENRRIEGLPPVLTFRYYQIRNSPLALLLGRFSGRVLRSGEHIIPEAALEALADQNISFSVIGRTTYEQPMAAIRGPAPTSVQ